MAARLAEQQLVEQRSRSRSRHAVHARIASIDDRVRLSRPGRAAGRHGPVRSPTRFRRLPRHVRRGRRRARRAAQHTVLRGAGRRADAHREHPARDSRRQRRRLRGWSSRAASRRRSRPATASASTRRTSRPVRYPSRMPCGRCAAAGGTCRRRCRWATGAMAAILGLDARRASTRVPARRPRSGEVVTPANLNAPGPGRDCRAHRCGGARRGARRKALGARSGSIPLAVSAPFHCALMKPAEDRLAPELRASDRARPARFRSWRNVDAEPKRTAGDVDRGARSARCRAPVRWEDVVRRLAREGVDARSGARSGHACWPG